MYEAKGALVSASSVKYSVVVLCKRNEELSAVELSVVHLESLKG